MLLGETGVVWLAGATAVRLFIQLNSKDSVFSSERRSAHGMIVQDLARVVLIEWMRLPDTATQANAQRGASRLDTGQARQ
jgi:hypothetical protein